MLKLDHRDDPEILTSAITGPESADSSSIIVSGSPEA